MDLLSLRWGESGIMRLPLNFILSLNTRTWAKLDGKDYGNGVGLLPPWQGEKETTKLP